METVLETKSKGFYLECANGDCGADLTVRSKNKPWVRFCEKHDKDNAFPFVLRGKGMECGKPCDINGVPYTDKEREKIWDDFQKRKLAKKTL